MPNTSPLLDAAVAIRPLLRDNAAQIEHERRLTPAVFDALYGMDAFNLQVNADYGGQAADPLTHLRVIEELSRGDASSGWCAMVGSEASSCVNAFLEPATIRAMLQEPERAVVALTAVGTGRAYASADGYHVEGHWRFASGCRHATWFGALCPVYDGDVARLRDTGAPVLRIVFAHSSDATLLDTWHTSGLQGTASDDFRLDKVFIPHQRAFDLFGPARDDSAVWRLPAGLRFALSKAAAACGIARGAMDALYPLLERVPFAGSLPAREEPRVQIGLAEAEAAIEGGRAYLYQNVAAAWESVQQGTMLDMAAIAKVRLAVVFAAHRAVEAVQLIQQLGGTAAVLTPALDRAARDLSVARHHLQLQPHVVEDVGRVLLNLAPRNPMF
jgi:alkylation response protein AidB-like acyl-CoA dehydrogenase